MKHNSAISSIDLKKKNRWVGGLECDVCVQKEHICAAVPRLRSEEKNGVKVPAAKIQKTSKRGRKRRHKKTEKLSEVTKGKSKGMYRRGSP